MQGGHQLAVAAASTVKALDQLGLVDAPHKTDAVSKVGEVGQVVVAAGGVHLHRGTHNGHQAQVPVLAAQATWEGHGPTLSTQKRGHDDHQDQTACPLQQSWEP
jgi:hypothetical protein